MSFLSDADKSEYEALIDEALDVSNFSNKTLIWKRARTKGLNRFMEDTTEEVANINLPCLCNYNYMRSWPITGYAEIGETDRQSVQVILSTKIIIGVQDSYNVYLADADGNLLYNPAYDRFILEGIEYKASGDTPASQGFTRNLMFTFILTRELKKTRNQ